MQKWHNLARLPSSPRFRSVQFRGQVPGSPAHFIKNATLKQVLDPTHPCVHTPASRFPKFFNEAFVMRAVPIALLWKYDRGACIDTWAERVQRAAVVRAQVEEERRSRMETEKKERGDAGWDLRDEIALAREVERAGVPYVAQMRLKDGRRYRYSMPLFMVRYVERLHANACVRVKVARRVKAALQMIVVRGADVDKTGKRPRVVFKEAEASNAAQWVLHGWAYTIAPTLVLYRMPYHKMIPILRNALTKVRALGVSMEKQWEKMVQAEAVKAKKQHPRISVVARTAAAVPPSETQKVQPARHQGGEVKVFKPFLAVTRTTAPAPAKPTPTEARPTLFEKRPRSVLTRKPRRSREAISNYFELPDLGLDDIDVDESRRTSMASSKGKSGARGKWKEGPDDDNDDVDDLFSNKF